MVPMLLDFAFSPQYVYCRHQDPILNIFLRFLSEILEIKIPVMIFVAGCATDKYMIYE